MERTAYVPETSGENCARRTVILHEAKDKLGKSASRKPKAISQSRVAVIEYPNTIVEQLEIRAKSL